MAEIPDRVPGGIILASYANDIRDRTLQRYADATARDASNPLPAEGEMAFLQSDNTTQVFAGGAWRTVVYTTRLDSDLAVVNGRLDVLEDQVWSDYFTDEKSISQTWAQLCAVTVQTAGDWYAEVCGFFEYDIALTGGLTSPAMGIQWRKNDVLQTQIVNIGGTGEGRHGANFSHRRAFIAADGDACVPGDEISVWARSNSGSVLSPNASEYQLKAQLVPTGIIGPENP